MFSLCMKKSYMKTTFVFFPQIIVNYCVDQCGLSMAAIWDIKRSVEQKWL